MSGFSQFAVAAVFVASCAGVAQAQSHSRQAPSGQGQYYALYGDRAVADRTADIAGPVPPSMSHTVMGLRVPR